MPAANHEKVYFKNLDILRCLAVFMVMVFHGHLAYTGWFHQPAWMAAKGDPKSPNEFGRLVENFIFNLDLGVDLFFLISGFLITFLLLREKAIVGQIHIRYFFIRRALRIWPLYFLMVLLSPVIVRISGEREPEYSWVIWFMENYYTIFNQSGQFPFVHFWSVCIEEHFYLVWPFLMAWVPTRKLPWIFLSVILLGILSRGLYYEFNPNWLMHITYNTICRMDVLAIGSWLGYWHFKNGLRINLARRWVAVIYSITALIFIFTRAHELSSLTDVVFKKYLYALPLAGCMMIFLFNQNRLTPGFRIVGILNYIGKISYGLYLFHNVLFAFLIKEVLYPNGEDRFWVFVLLYLGATFILAILSYELMEKYFLKKKKRFSRILTG